MDVFYAAHLVGGTGRATGIDFTPEQLDKARRLGAEGGFAQVDFVEGAIDDTPFGDGFFDCVISNGVINLAPDKAQVFTEAARGLRPGGRIAVADIVTERQLTEAIVCDTDLWASCIGGAAQQDAYRDAIEAAGLTIDEVRDNTYSFISRQAVRASAKYGVRSVSVLAHKAH